MSIRFIPVALIAATVALVAVSGAALAFGRGGSDAESRDDLLERASDVLGIESQALKDALTQAQSELETERQRAVLAELVEDGLISQEEADEASAWLEQKPEAVDRVMRPDILLRIASSQIGNAIIWDGDGLNFPLLDGELTEKMAEILGIEPESLEQALETARSGQVEDRRAEVIDDVVQTLVEDGEITESEGNEIRSWLNAMPEWLGDHGLLFRIFSHGLRGGFEANVFGGLPFLHDLEGHRFEFAPRLEERKWHHEFFMTPDGAFSGPGFEFGLPSEDGTAPFFFRGPGGRFEFEGMQPEDFEDIFGNLDRLLEEYEGHEDIFERFTPFEFYYEHEDSDEQSDAEETATDGQSA